METLEKGLENLDREYKFTKDKEDFIWKVFNGKKGIWERHVYNKFGELLKKIDFKEDKISSYDVTYNADPEYERGFTIRINEITESHGENSKSHGWINLFIKRYLLKGEEIDDFKKNNYVIKIEPGE